MGSDEVNRPRIQSIRETAVAIQDLTRDKPERAFEAVGGEVPPEVTGEVISPVWPQPESRPESLEIRVLRHLDASPLGKAELSIALGHKEISGQLNKVIRVLLGDQIIEYTIPEKPNSRMQKYRLTEKGKVHLASMKAKGEKR
jgi:hypothetical protein